MTPRQIPVVKAVVRASYLAEAEDLAARALALGSELEVERLVLGVMANRFGPEIEGLPIVADARDSPPAEADRALNARGGTEGRARSSALV